jgi:DNA repair exonuclease SbcCD ATPase subunit
MEMIRSLKVNQFGRFQNRTFDLGEVTIFYGKNEAGKSTLSDALFYALCRPRKNLKSGKLLSERYGDSISVEIVPEIESIPEEEYRNLYSIRSNDLFLEINPEAEWGKELRRRLFSGTIDPEGIIRELDTMASEKGNVKKMKELTSERKTEEGLEREIAQLKAEWRNIMAEMSGVERDSVSLREIEGRKKGLEESIRSITEKAAIEEKIRERIKWTKLLEDIISIDKSKKRIEELGAFAAAEPTELIAFEREGIEAEKKIAELMARVAMHSEESTRLKGSLEQLTASEREAKSLSDQAALYMDRAEIDRKNLRPREIRKMKPAALIAAALTALITLSTLFIAEISPVVRIAIVIAGLVGASAIALLSRGIVYEFDPEAEREGLNRLAAKWRSDTGREIGSASYDLLIQELTRSRSAHEELRRGIAAAVARLTELTDRLSEQERLLEGVQSDRSRMEERLNNWLTIRKIRSRDDYYRNHAELMSQSSSVTSKMNTPEFRTAPPERLRLEAERRLRILDEERVPAEGISDAEFARIRAESENLRKELDEVHRREMEIRGRMERSSGDAQGRISLLAPELVRLEEQLFESRERRGRIELDRRASLVAKQIFEKLVQDIDNNYTDLESRIESFFGDLLPNRKVSSAKMDIKGYRVTDAGGVQRGADHLSAGTKDLFIFTAKLALAEKMRKEAGVLVLDDPFLTLDEERETGALRMLEHFRTEHGIWQIILFTKESRLRDKARRVFKNALLHDITAPV